MAEKLVKYTGGCHCGAIRYEVLAPESLVVTDCTWVLLVRRVILCKGTL